MGDTVSVPIALLIIFGSITLVSLAVFLFPERIDKVRGTIWGALEHIWFLAQRANKEKNKYSIQGVVNTFSSNLNKDLPSFSPPKIQLEYVDQNKDREAFIHEGKAVIRIRRNDPDHVNTVTACMLYVSNILLRKSIRYVSPSQRKAIELYTGYKLLAESQPVFKEFVQNWLHPGIEESDEKVGKYFDDFIDLDKAEFFIPVLLQEIVHLGEKVFGTKRDGKIIEEVDSIVEFLKNHALRRLGDAAPPYLDGSNCRFGIMIVGIFGKVEQAQHSVYVNHIRNKLLPENVETIYLLGNPSNKSFIDRVASMVSSDYPKLYDKQFDVTLFARDGSEYKAKSYLVVVRKQTRVHYIP